MIIYGVMMQLAARSYDELCGLHLRKAKIQYMHVSDDGLECLTRRETGTYLIMCGLRVMSVEFNMSKMVR
jgi:hypothetical protein